MKRLLAYLCLLSFFSTAFAAYTTDGRLVTNQDTGLEWLQLTETTGLTYEQALVANQAEGWRYATNDEIIGMFNDFFPTFVANTPQNSSVYSTEFTNTTYSCGIFGNQTCSTYTTTSTPDSAYSRDTQNTDIDNWQSIFYANDVSSGTIYYQGGKKTFSGRYTRGFYRNANGDLGELFAGYGQNSDKNASYGYSASSSTVRGLDYIYNASLNNLSAGSFLVRSQSVFEAPSIFLFSFGLLVLFARKR